MPCPNRVDPLLLALHDRAQEAVVQATHTAAFIAKHIARQYQLQPGDEITESGVIVRAQAAAE